MTRNPKTTAFRRAIVAEWNKAEKSMTEIGAMFGKPRTSISRYLCEARMMGWYVLAVDHHTMAVRSRVALRRNLGEAGYRDYYVKQAELMRAVRWPESA